MKRYLNQLECKILRAGDSLFNSTTTDNLLIFVFSGKLIIYSQEGTHIAEVAKDHFMLLAQNTNHKVIRGCGIKQGISGSQYFAFKLI